MGSGYPPRRFWVLATSTCLHGRGYKRGIPTKNKNVGEITIKMMKHTLISTSPQIKSYTRHNLWDRHASSSFRRCRWTTTHLNTIVMKHILYPCRPIGNHNKSPEIHVQHPSANAQSVPNTLLSHSMSSFHPYACCMYCLQKFILITVTPVEQREFTCP